MPVLGVSIDRSPARRKGNAAIARLFFSREITPTSFKNEYSFGDFKGDANRWMEKYFDAYFYLANWGTHELQLRVSSNLLPVETARRYCAGESAPMCAAWTPLGKVLDDSIVLRDVPAIHDAEAER